ncbi:MAG: hypothetical protein HYZ18_06545 [Pseudogulbenkiania sp.]|nr:hypothetical protein [Pseudogulbenkiania sp.]
MIRDQGGAILATVKPPSTPAVASDTALVVAQHAATSSTKVGDGTNTVAVKAASTPAAASDPALVVALHLLSNSATPYNATVTDIASAAIAGVTTYTSAAIAQGGTNAAEFVVVVTSVSGTSPSLDVVIQESDDTGTNWQDIYHFPRITAAGAYRSSLLRLTGNRLRYVRTVGGTTPSFTLSLVRNNYPYANPDKLRCQFNRSLNPNTQGSTTPALFVEGTSRLQLVVNMGAITTTVPVLGLQGSEDNVNWYDVGPSLAAVANGTVQLTEPDIAVKFVRAIVKTAGVGATLVMCT